MRMLRFFLPVALFAVGLLACTKDSGTTPVTERKSILNNIPGTTIGFLTWNTSSPAYQRFRESPWGNWGLSFMKDLQKSGATPPEGQAELEKVYAVMQVLTDAGLFNPDPKKNDIIEEGVAFVDAPSIQDLAGGVYLSAKKGEELGAVVTKMKPLLASKGFTVKDTTAGDVVGISILPATPAPQTPDMQGGDMQAMGMNSPSIASTAIYLSAKNELMAASTSPKLVQYPFTPGIEDGFAKIRSTAGYQSGTKTVNFSGDELSFGFFDIQRTLDLVKTFPGLPPSEELSLVPIDSIVFTRTMKDTLSDRLAISFTARNENQKTIFANLEKGGQQELLKKAPKDLVFLLSLDGQVISSLKDIALKEMSDQEKADAQIYLGLLDSIKGLGIGVQKSSGASPFPDLIVMAQSTNAPQLKDTMKETLGAAAGAQMGAGLQWQEKDVEGTKASYFATPFGVGVYMGAVNDVLYITSSEGALKQSVAGGAPGLIDSLSKPSQTLLANSSLLSAYTDFGTVGDLVDSVQGSLAMFTGGQAGAIDPAQIDRIKKIGKFATTLSFKGGTLEVKTSLEPSSPQAKG